MDEITSQQQVTRGRDKTDECPEKTKVMDTKFRHWSNGYSRRLMS